MPDNDFLLDEDEDSTEKDSAPSKGEGESEGDEASKSSDKRVRDLQSKADKETARANKAETRLKALETALKEGDPEVEKPPASTGADVILDMARMFAVQQNPKLAEYGLTATDLTGGTPTEIAANAASLVARYEKLETQIRNKVLAANGLAPEIEGETQTQSKQDFSKMSTEDFNKLVEQTMRR